jgi:ferric iron reductase protein FhuF
MSGVSDTTLEGAAAQLASLPPRFHVATTPSPGAVSLAALADPAVARTLVMRHHAARRLDQHPWRKPTVPTQIAASLTVQGIAMRLGGSVLAALALHRTLLRVRPEDIHIAATGPMFDIAISAASVSQVDDRDDALTAWAEHWLDGHFRTLVDDVAAAHRVGAALLWGNVASAVAASFVFFDWWSPSSDARGWAERALEFGAPPLGRSSSLADVTVRGRTGLRSERSSCCLAKLIPDGHICPTCPKVSDAERRAITAEHVEHLFAVRDGARRPGPG